MIRHAFTRRPGGRRFSLSDFAALRALASNEAPDTLPGAAIAAMTDPDGIEALVDVSFEIESNRMGREVDTRFVMATALPEWNNRHRNPRAAVDTSGWVAAGGAIATVAGNVYEPTIPGYPQGGVQFTAAGAAIGYVTVAGDVGQANGQIGAVTPGQYVATRLVVESGPPRDLVYTLELVTMNGGADVAVIPLDVETVPDQPFRVDVLSGTYQIPAGVTTARVRVKVTEVGGGALIAGTVARVSYAATYVLDVPFATPLGRIPFGAGDMAGWEWIGAAHASRSRPALIPLEDPTTMDLETLTTGRRNGTQAFAVADSAIADVAVVWDTNGTDDEHPVAPTSDLFVARPTVPAPSLEVGAVAGPDTTEQWSAGKFITEQWYPDVSAPGDPGRVAVNEPRPLYLADRNGAALSSGNGFDVIHGAFIGGLRRILPGRPRTVTVVGSFATDGVGVTIEPAIIFASFSGAISIASGREPTTIPPGSPDLVTVSSTFAIDPGVDIYGIRLLYQVKPGTATRIEWTDAQLYFGDRRGREVGIEAGVLDPGLAVEELFDSPRRINRVEVSGDVRLSPVTAISVEALAPDGDTWSLVGTGEGIRAACDFPTIDTLGVRVWIEEIGARGGVPFLSEVDPMLVRQLSGDDGIEELAVEWSRETEPGTSTNPVGSYEASTLELTLDNSAGEWLPQRNASLDLGHRVGVGIGVRYTNILPNPRAENDADGWIRRVGSGAATPATRELLTDPSAPFGSGFPIATGATLTPVRLIGPAIPCGNLDGMTAGGWIKVDGPDGSTVTLSIATYGSTIETDPAAATARATSAAVKVSDGWAFVPPPLIYGGADTVAARVEIAVVAGTLAGAVAHATRMSVKRYSGGVVDERETILPAGVFYTEPYDTDSDSPDVRISAVDRLGRFKDVEVAEPVRVAQTVGEIVTAVALTYLDYDADQVVIDPQIADYVIPYAFPSGGVGSYLADLAKAVVGTLHVDPMDRLVLGQRAGVTNEIVAEIRADNALIAYKRPPAYDTTTSIVTVTAAPLVLEAAAEVWAMPPGGIAIPPSGVYALTAVYESSPALNGYVTGIVADGGYAIDSAVFYSDRAEIKIRNTSAVTTRVVADLRVWASPLVEAPLTATRTHELSRRRYGPRRLEVEAKLVQTQAQLEAITEVLLDSFRAVDDNGVRRLPDLSFDALGLIHTTAGDRVALSDPRTSLGSEYAILGRKLTYANGGSLLANDVRVREALTVWFAVADDALADDDRFVGY